MYLVSWHLLFSNWDFSNCLFLCCLNWPPKCYKLSGVITRLVPNENREEYHEDWISDLDHFYYSLTSISPGNVRELKTAVWNTLNDLLCLVFRQVVSCDLGAFLPPTVLESRIIYTHFTHGHKHHFKSHCFSQVPSSQQPSVCRNTTFLYCPLPTSLPSV